MKNILVLLSLGLGLAALGTLVLIPSSNQTSLDVLRIGVLPDESEEILRQRYSPLVKYLGAVLDVKTRLVVPEDYADAVRLFANREVELAYFGGLTFVQANALYGARPLVMREVDTRFTSWFVADPELAHLDLSGFKNRRLSFGSQLSTSGHLMPRHFLVTEWQVDPETWFSQIEYSGAHDETVYRVRDGKADLGAVNSAIFRKMLADGRLQEDELHIVWRTPPYPDYVWATQEFLDTERVTQLRDAFLALDKEHAGHERILDKLDAEEFLPAGNAEFDDLRAIALDLGFLQ